MKYLHPNWAQNLSRKWKNRGVPSAERHEFLLRKGIKCLEDARKSLPRLNTFELNEQPFDRHLLHCSPLYRRSRKAYLERGGKFLATLVSSPRTLSSPILLEQRIEYSPIEREMIWRAIDPLEAKKKGGLIEVCTFSSSLFHEQNHRNLWTLLPKAPQNWNGLVRYLNFAESLVIVADMALADQLGPELASLFYLTGVTYDPGTSVFAECQSRREYRNYLQASLHATYLHLEFFAEEDIFKVVRFLFPHSQELAMRAAQRSIQLDPSFVRKTNPIWQRKHKKTLSAQLSGTGSDVLDLPKSPLDHRLQYLFAEKWFDYLGV